MASIQINKEFTMPEDELRGMIDQLATKLTDELQVECSRQSDRCLDFKRSGAEGQINISDQAVDLSLRLGLMFSAFRGPIEESIHEFIDENIY